GALKIAQTCLRRIEVGFHGLAHRGGLVAAHVREGSKQRLGIAHDLAEIVEQLGLGGGEVGILRHGFSPEGAGEDRAESITHAQSDASTASPAEMRITRRKPATNAAAT